MYRYKLLITTGLSLNTIMTGSIKLLNSVCPPIDTVAATTGEPTWDMIPSSFGKSNSPAIGNSEGDSYNVKNIPTSPALDSNCVKSDEGRKAVPSSSGARDSSAFPAPPLVVPSVPA